MSLGRWRETESRNGIRKPQQAGLAEPEGADRLGARVRRRGREDLGGGLALSDDASFLGDELEPHPSLSRDRCLCASHRRRRPGERGARRLGQVVEVVVQGGGDLTGKPPARDRTLETHNEVVSESCLRVNAGTPPADSGVGMTWRAVAGPSRELQSQRNCPVGEVRTADRANGVGLAQYSWQPERR